MALALPPPSIKSTGSCLNQTCVLHKGANNNPTPANTVPALEAAESSGSVPSVAVSLSVQENAHDGSQGLTCTFSSC
jgi:hypothetical protein